MAYNPQNPLIVQGDRTVLLEVHNSLYEEARDRLAAFAELEKSPEHVHTYRITPLSLWNAAAAGLSAQEMVDCLTTYGKFDLPDNVRRDILDFVGRYGLVQLLQREGRLVLYSADPAAIQEIWRHKALKPRLGDLLDPHTILVPPGNRGAVKQELIKIGFPAEDLAGYQDGAALDIRLREITPAGQPFALREYQHQAVEAFYAGGSARGGSGVLVLPCGAGKTVIGLAAMSRLGCETLVLTTNITAARQWIRELLDKTWLDPSLVGEYSGEVKEVKPVTVATYQILTARTRKDGEFTHFALFNQKDWGLIIYDEVHLLPAPVFRATAEIQARRRLGLTATLVREDQREGDVFTLIGPKKYDVPWKELERQGWIATAQCTEVRLELPSDIRMAYAMADHREKFRIASENPGKVELVQRLVERHRGDRILIIGQYLDQLKELAAVLDAPLITGQVGNREREQLYNAFRAGEVEVLVVSKVANFAVDLPDANVAIQVSGTFGSRQEEAQRLGRILRPKANGAQAHFYSLVTRDTRDHDFAMNRQLFLTEQGYRYRIIHADELAAG